jgi:hypothetical protein
VEYCNGATTSYVSKLGGIYKYMRLEICKDVELRCCKDVKFVSYNDVGLKSCKDARLRSCIRHEAANLYEDEVEKL